MRKWGTTITRSDSPQLTGIIRLCPHKKGSKRPPNASRRPPGPEQLRVIYQMLCIACKVEASLPVNICLEV